MAAAPAPARRRKLIGHRRRVEEEGEDDAGLDQLDGDDSMSDGSMASDDLDPADDSDTSNLEEPSPSAPTNKPSAHGSGKKDRAKHAKPSKPLPAGPDAANSPKPIDSSLSGAEGLLNGLSIKDESAPAPETDPGHASDATPKSAAPIVVSSSSAAPPGGERRRREHDEYRKKRDEDPAFVPNRGAFFMHDHRSTGPSANGFRPFGRGGRGRGGRGGIGGPFAPYSQPMHNPADPTTSAPWAHDMHEAVAQPVQARQARHSFADDGPPNGDGIIPTCPSSSQPINRKMSTEKLLGNVQVRVFLSSMKEPAVFSGIPIKQYTKLPDHRPPLRRDKPVRISLPALPHRYVFPATDRSFIFIPRALRPNQQRLRGKPRSGLGSIGGFSRRTSVFGGSYYGGSVYSPSVAMSRRSSIAQDAGRDFIMSPTGSTISRPPLAHEMARPVVRLPPHGRPEQQPQVYQGVPPEAHHNGQAAVAMDMPQPPAHPYIQKPEFQENQAVSLPMHQPRPQKTITLGDIEAPAAQSPYQQAFHHQMPPQVPFSGHDSHVRQHSYASQHSTGTPLSQIPERAIHAAPFQPQPAQYPQQGYYGSFQPMQPQQGYYYPPPPYNNGSMAPPAAPPYMPGAQPGQPQPDAASGQSGSNLVAQEVNGMVYYYDASQLPPMANNYPTYPGPQGYPMAGNMNGAMTPSQDGYYYPPPPPPTGTVYYPQ